MTPLGSGEVEQGPSYLFSTLSDEVFSRGFNGFEFLRNYHRQHPFVGIGLDFVRVDPFWQPERAIENAKPRLGDIDVVLFIRIARALLALDRQLAITER